MSAPRIPKTSRMTANPIRPARYRPGKAVAESSSDDGDDDNDEVDDAEPESQQPSQTAPPKATSFPKHVTSNLKHVDLNERKRQAEREKRKTEWLEQRRRREEREEQERMERDAGFVTESSSDEEEAQRTTSTKPSATRTSAAASTKPPSESDSYDSASSSSEEEEDSSSSSSSEDEPKLLRPIFTKPTANPHLQPTDTLTATSTDPTHLAARRVETDAQIQQQIDARAALKASASLDWDADDTALADEDAIDDRDGLDPELEHQQWVARELGRLRRDRQALEEREKEIAELERRRNLSTPEREAEDRAYLEQQKAEREDKGQMAFLQKYQHRGAFFQDDDEAGGLAKRDLMGARYVDQVDKEGLPEYLKRRDERMVGRKGATRYKDMRSEDTGAFGGFLREAGGRGEKRKLVEGEKGVGKRTKREDG